MAEVLTLTTPTTRLSYSVDYLSLNWRGAHISVQLRGDDGNVINADYNGSTALALMIGLNKANLSVKSLQARILERLVADGKIPGGSVAGFPD